MSLVDWAKGRAFDVWHPDECRAGECSQGANCSPKNHGKHPVLAGWQSAPYEGGRNVGLRTGNGIGVLDVDDLDAFNALEAEHGSLPPGPRVRTGSGGLHVFFRVDRPLRNRRGFREGLDWRGDGGYVVFAGSTHASGNVYLPEGFELDLPDAPEWLVNLVDGRTTVGIRAQSAFDLQKFLKEAKAAVSGSGGHDRLFHVAATIVEKGQVFEWSEFYRLISDYNARCSPPWDEEALRHKFEDILGAYQAKELVEVPRNKEGRPSQAFMWVLKIVEEDKLTRGKLKKNLLGEVAEFDGEAICDATTRKLTTDLARRYGWTELSRHKVEQAAEDVVARNEYSPVVDYLDTLEWDGVERLNQVAHDVLGASGDLAAQEVACWMVGAVARAYEPGIRWDNVLILKGDQGRGKSTFFRTLGGAWYDETPVDLHNKDSMQTIGRCWLYCWDEIATSWGRKEVNLVKNFVTRLTDVYRPPFEKYTKEVRRRCVFAATTNDDEILYDNTGSRRFWVVDCPGAIKVGSRVEFNLPWLRENRDQLWAEARDRYRKLPCPKVDHLGLPRDLDDARAEFNKQFEPEDVTFEKTLQKIDELRKMSSYPGFVLLAEMQDGLREKWERASVRRALHHEGFVPKVQRVAGRPTRVWLDVARPDTGLSGSSSPSSPSPKRNRNRGATRKPK